MLGFTEVCDILVTPSMKANVTSILALPGFKLSESHAKPSLCCRVIESSS